MKSKKAPAYKDPHKESSNLTPNYVLYDHQS